MIERIYNINETFYSLEGEGQWTGQAMFFIRLAGCNLKCEWCDTDHPVTCRMTITELVSEALQYPSKHVEITGGEPTLQDITPLLRTLKHKGFYTHMQTNGTKMILVDSIDWLVVSPKGTTAPLTPLAKEIKFSCGYPGWLEYMEETIKTLRLNPDRCWLSPINTKDKEESDKNTQLAITYCRAHPNIRLCTQLHKLLNFK